MRKVMIAGIIVVLLMSSIFEFPHALAEETGIDPDTACRDFDFYMETPVEEDKEIKGQAVPKEEVLLTLDGKKLSTEVTDQQGKYTFKLNQPLEENQKVKVELSQNKIESNVYVKEDVIDSKVAFNSTLDCSGLEMTKQLIEDKKVREAEEKAQAEKEEAERVAAEEAEQEKKAAEQREKEEQAQAEKEEAERIAAEKAEQEKKAAEQKGAEQKAEEEQEQTDNQDEFDDLSEEGQVDQSSEEKDLDKETTDDETEEETSADVDEDKAEYKSEQADDENESDNINEDSQKDEQETEIEHTESELEINDLNEKNNKIDSLERMNQLPVVSNLAEDIDCSGIIIVPRQCVSTTIFMDSELKNENSQIVKHRRIGTFNHNMPIREVSIRSKTGYKIWDGNNKDLSINTSQNLFDTHYELGNDLNELTLRNFNSIQGAGGVSGPDNGFLVSKSAAQLNVENVNFTSANQWKFFYAATSNIHFSGNNSISTNHPRRVLMINNLVTAAGQGTTTITQTGAQTQGEGAVYINGNTLTVGNDYNFRIVTNGRNIHSNNPLNLKVDQGGFLQLVNNGGVGRLFTQSTNGNINAQGMVLGLWENNNLTGRPQEFTKQTITSNPLAFNSREITFGSKKFNLQNKSGLLIETPSSKPTVNEANQGDQSITGQAANGSTVYLLNQNGDVLAQQTANGGTFSFNVSAFDGDSFKVDVINPGKKIPSEAVEVTLKSPEPPVLEFENAPSDIVFETTEIKDGMVEVERTDDFNLDIKNTHDETDWTLSVKADTPMSNGNDQLDEGSLILKQHGEECLIMNQCLVTSGDEFESADDSIYNLNWNKNEGILLKLNPIQASEGEYSTKLTWELSNGP